MQAVNRASRFSFRRLIEVASDFFHRLFTAKTQPEKPCGKSVAARRNDF